jgi:succinyl-CoA synthetase alpha subunit
VATGYVIRKDQYYDSVFLMGVNSRLSKAAGVRQSAVLMGSQANKALLADLGIRGGAIDEAGANDLVIAVVADDEQAVASALEGVDAAMQAVEIGTSRSEVHTLEDGIRRLPSANLVVLTIPGEYVHAEARKALEAGLHLFIFSSNVPLDQELELKQLAASKGLLVMGPDCGTSILGGVGLGFANAVRRGAIGVIGPSGTGLQEFTCGVHHAGAGISHAIGTGSHDLSDDIGGATTFTALAALERDPSTKVIAIVAKPGGERTRAILASRLQACRKPVVACLLGMADGEPGSTLSWAATIDEAVRAAVERCGSSGVDPASSALTMTDPDLGHQEGVRRAASQRFLRGLFAGGTFCYQSQQILSRAGLSSLSNAPLSEDHRLVDPMKSVGHTLVDTGDDAHTRGRLHPMIDGTLRAQRVVTESVDPETAILLLDFILGTNAAPDPVGDIVGAIVEGRRLRPREAGEVTVVASICGTEQDPQDLSRQAQALIDAGVHVFWSNARATEHCLARLEVAD